MSNKKTFRKYAVTTMAAATAATAVVPAAVSADTQSKFPDVEIGDKHYTAIMALTEAGVIEGKTDGTFDKWGKVTRSQVAEMLYRQLDLEVPSDLEGALKDYSDIDANHEKAEAVAAVTQAGIFEGLDDGTFGKYEDITRQQMATVLVEALDLEQYDNGEDVNINLRKVSSVHEKNVQILANLGITDQLGDNEDNLYQGYDPITRAAFASFLHRANEVVADGEQEEAARFAVESVNAVNAQEIKVQFSQAVDRDSARNLDNYTVSKNNDELSAESFVNVEGNQLTAASVSTDGKTVTFLLEEDAVLDNGDKYSIDVKDGVLTADRETQVERYGEGQLRFMDNDAPEIVEVNPKIGSNEVIVNFDEPITDQADGRDDFAVTVNGKEVSDYTIVNEIDTYQLVLDVDEKDLENGEHTVKVYNVRDIVSNNGAGGNIANNLTGNYTISDVAPVVESVEPLNFNEFRIKFNKPVTDATVNVLKGTTEFYGAKVDTEGGLTATVTLPVNVLTDSGVTKGLTPLFDTGANSTDITVTVSDYKDSEKLMGVEKTFNTTLERSDATPVAIGTGYNTIENVAGEDDAAGSVVLHIPLKEYKDQAGIELVDADKITVTDVDGVSRTVEDVVVSEEGVLKVTLSAETVDGETLPEYVDAKIPYSVTVGAGALSVETDQVKLDNVPKNKNDEDNKYLATDFTNKLVNDTFTTEVRDSNVEDHYAVEGVDSVVSSDDNVITITYDQKMDSKSATNLNNYLLDGKALPNGTKATIDENNKVVKLTLPAEQYEENVQIPLTITKNVKTATGSYIVGNIQDKTEFNSELLTITDNIKPVLESGTFVIAKEGDKTTNVIDLTFSENIETDDAAGLADNFEVVEGSTTADINSVEVINDDADEPTKVRITVVSADEEDAFNVSNDVTVSVKVDDNGEIHLTDEAGNELTVGTVSVSGTIVDKDIANGEEGTPTE